MQETTAKLITILAGYGQFREVGIDGASSLAELGIDALDLPMILLDIEDTFDVHLALGSDFEELATVADLEALVEAGIRGRHEQGRRATPRKKSNWMSTSARA